MPRNERGVFTYPPMTEPGPTGSPISSSRMAQRFEDIANDLNTARSVVMGGTGANSAAQARSNLGAAATGENVRFLNYVNMGAPGVNFALHYDGANGFGLLNKDGSWSLRLDHANSRWYAPSFSSQGISTATYFLSQQAYPQYQMLYPGVRQWSMQVRENAYWYLWDDSAGAARMWVGPDGSLATAQLGDINNRIKSRAAAWANDRVAGLSYRLVSPGRIGGVNGGTSFPAGNYYAPSGAVLTGISVNNDTPGRVWGVEYRYLQAYDPVRGWVGFYNA